MVRVQSDLRSSAQHENGVHLAESRPGFKLQSEPRFARLINWFLGGSAEARKSDGQQRAAAASGVDTLIQLHSRITASYTFVFFHCVIKAAGPVLELSFLQLQVAFVTDLTTTQYQACRGPCLSHSVPTTPPGLPLLPRTSGYGSRWCHLTYARAN